MNSWYIPEIYKHKEFAKFKPEELPKIVAFTPTGLFITHDGQVFDLKDDGRFGTLQVSIHTNRQKAKHLVYKLKFHRPLFQQFVAMSNINKPMPQAVYDELHIMKSYCPECINNLNSFNNSKVICKAKTKCRFYYYPIEQGVPNYSKTEELTTFFSSYGERNIWLKKFSMINATLEEDQWRPIHGITFAGHSIDTWLTLENMIQTKITTILERIFLVNILGYSGLVTYNGIPIVNTRANSNSSSSSSRELVVSVPQSKSPVPQQSTVFVKPGPQNPTAPNSWLNKVKMSKPNDAVVAKKDFKSNQYSSPTQHECDIVNTNDHYNISIKDVVSKLQICDRSADTIGLILGDIEGVIQNYSVGSVQVFEQLLMIQGRLIDLQVDLRLPK